jgi:hypothetical protein
MAFSESPRLEEGEIVSRPSLGGWIKKHRLFLYLSIAVLLLVDVFVIIYSANPAAFQKPPGGLDGCIMTPDGQPATGSIHVDEIVRPIYLDGCFFFPSLSPGEHLFTVETPNGVFLYREVDIVSGEALSLGTLNLP